MIRDDVVAGAAEHDVVAGAALEPVVAGIAIERVVAVAGDDDVVAGRAAEHDVVLAGVVQVVGVGPGACAGLSRITSGMISTPLIVDAAGRDRRGRRRPGR